MLSLFSVQFRTTDDAIKIRSNRKLLKQWPHLYMKYGRDQNKHMKRPDNDQPDEEVDELTNLAGKGILVKASLLQAMFSFDKNNFKNHSNWAVASQNLLLVVK